MHRTIIAASPRVEGRSAAIADALFEACIDECPEDGVSVVAVSSVSIAACVGCDGCAVAIDADSERYPSIPEKGDPLMQTRVVFKSDASAHQCVIEDDFSEVRKHIDAADELIVVSPVYFAGAPSQFKALLDRMQPYYRSNLRTRTKERRPMTLHVIREGGDPHGYAGLVASVKSAFGVAGFTLERMLDWCGCIDESGEITCEPTEVDVVQDAAWLGVAGSDGVKQA